MDEERLVVAACLPGFTGEETEGPSGTGMFKISGEQGPGPVPPDNTPLCPPQESSP